MVTKDHQTLGLKFDQVMFNSLVLTWERNFEVTFGIFSVLVFQISVLESYDQECENCDNLGILHQFNLYLLLICGKEIGDL